MMEGREAVALSWAGLSGRWRRHEDGWEKVLLGENRSEACSSSH